jgi:hypothetical protein
MRMKKGENEGERIQWDEDDEMRPPINQPNPPVRPNPSQLPTTYLF